MGEALTVSVEAAAQLLGVSRSLAYAEARRGSLAGVPVIRCGRRLLVPARALRRVLDGGGPLPGEQGPDARCDGGDAA